MEVSINMRIDVPANTEDEALEWVYENIQLEAKICIKGIKHITNR